MALPADIPALKKVWKICFDDTDEAIDSFFSHAFHQNTTLVLFEHEKPVSMLTLLPAIWKSSQRKSKGYYVYAVATLPEARGKGYMRTLEEGACRLAQQTKKEFCLLVPATHSLTAMYAKLGYKPFSSVDTIPLNSNSKNQSCSLQSCGFDDFYALRTQYLSRFHQAVRFDKPYEHYAYQEYLRSGGWIFSLYNGYLCAYPSKKSLMITETSLSKSEIESALPDLFTYTSCVQATLRIPGKQVFSMIKWLNHPKSQIEIKENTPRNYFGFALE